MSGIRFQDPGTTPVFLSLVLVVVLVLEMGAGAGPIARRSLKSCQERSMNGSTSSISLLRPRGTAQRMT